MAAESGLKISTKLFIIVDKTKLQTKRIQAFYGIYLELINNTYVGFHGAVVLVAGQFHDDFGIVALCERLGSKGPSAGMGPYQLILGFVCVNPFLSTILGDTYGLINAGSFADFFQVKVHPLIGLNWQGFVLGEGDVLILVQNSFGDGVKADGKTILSLFRGNHDAIFLHVPAA